jgi:hypothetical protein
VRDASGKYYLLDSVLFKVVMPTNFQNAQMVTVIHRTLKIIYRSLLVARAARTKGCSLFSFAHSILLRFAAQSFNTAKKSLEKFFDYSL